MSSAVKVISNFWSTFFRLTPFTRRSSKPKALRTKKRNYPSKLAQLIEPANALIFGIDKHGIVDQWNKSVERLTGFSKADAIGRNFVADFVLEGFREAVSMKLDKALVGETTVSFDFPMQTKSGDRVDLLLNATTRRTKSGKIIGVVGVGSDITELKWERNEQKRISNHLKKLIDTANAPILGVDEHGNVNEWNQTVERITGFTKQEAMGQNLIACYVTDEHKEFALEVLRKALAGTEIVNYQLPLRTKTGGRVDVLFNSTSRDDTNGKICCVIGVGKDITELNKERAKHEQIADDLTILIDTANAPIFGIDADGNVNEWNQTAERITGFTKHEVMGQDLVARYITDDYKHSVSGVLDKALAGEQTANYEFPLYTKSGDRVDVLLNSTTRRDADGNIIGVVGVGQDITELNKERAKHEQIADDLTILIDTANAPIFGIDA
ncbi:MAG: PAS domain S-box protein, partial [Planctomycetaceae bacterium]|nr:PAS domain S-box protein [Planctomycetaceae bacterium]